MPLDSVNLDRHVTGLVGVAFCAVQRHLDLATYHFLNYS